jgi:hypothetical protein
MLLTFNPDTVERELAACATEPVQPCLIDAERSPPERAAVLRSISATSAVWVEPLPLPRHAVSPEACAHNDAVRLSAVARFSECSA